jgi:hypothetical protein
MILFAILISCYTFLENIWFGPARLGVKTQAEFNRLIAENQWDGFIAPTHYLQDVRIGLYQCDESEIRKLYPSLHKISWLKHIRIHAPPVSESMLDELRREFPDCTLEIDLCETRGASD